MLNNTKTKLRHIIGTQKHNLLAFSFFFIITTIISWPILTQLNSVIIGIDNDVYINPWADWWTRTALQSADATLWETDFLFFPQGANLIYHSFSHLNTLSSLTLQTIFDPLPAYNLTILFNYVLTGFAMYQLVRYLTDSSSAGIVGGIVFAFSSHNLYQSSHPVLVSIWCFPWVTLYLMRAVEEKRFKWAIIAGIFVFLGAFSSTLLLILLVIWVMILLLFMLVSKEWSRPPWSIIVVFGSVSALLTLPLLLPLLYEAILSENSNFIIDPLNSITTDLFFWSVPHWAFWHSRSLYLGIVPLSLSIIALIKCPQKAKLWLILFVFSVLMSLGPQPTFLGTKFDIILPWSTFVAPVIRNTYRFNILASFGFSVLAALGWQEIYKLMPENRTQQYAISIILISIILVDYLLPLMPYTPIEVSPFYTDFLPNEPNDIAIATLPGGRQEGKYHLFYQTFHERPITSGVISRADSDTFEYIYNNDILAAGEVPITPFTTSVQEETTPMPLSLPTDIDHSLIDLANDNIKYLVIDKILIRELDPWREAIPYPPFYEDDLIIVYETAVTP